jgi:broad specificity phosphatase PhoE
MRSGLGFVLLILVAASVTPLVAVSFESRIKAILFVRHGQAESNIAKCEERPDLRDPFLTELGIRQAQCVLPMLHHFIGRDFLPDLILFSPLRRAIQTLNISLIKFCLGTTTICVPLADLQENNNGIFACDTGHSPSKLQRQYPHLNFSSLALDWMSDGHHSTQIERLSIRHTRVREWLSNTSKRSIVIFAHQGTIRGE